ncbi:MAG: hypothetical protein V9E94_02025 [Microthrixaceae bacterium]
MSYARTAAAGGGPVWYPGAPVVEGITNPGWTAVMAAVHRLGLHGSAGAARDRCGGPGGGVGDRVVRRTSALRRGPAHPSWGAAGGQRSLRWC